MKADSSIDNDISRAPQDECGHGCSRCGMGDVDSPKQGEDLLEGRKLALCAGCVFILPVAGALLGAALSGHDPNIKFVATVVGLTGGGVAAWLVSRLTRLLRPAGRETGGRSDG